MKIWYFSDTQLNEIVSAQDRAYNEVVRRIGNMPKDLPAHANLNFDPGTEADVCVIAGDFCPNILSSVERLASIAKRMPVIYVPGNRDLWSSRIFPMPMKALLQIAKRRAIEIGNIFILQDEKIQIGNVTFLGATLWSDLSGKDVEPLIGKWNDFRCIYTTPEKTFTVSDHTKAFKKSKRFIEKSLKTSETPINVVVTHTIPHPVGRSPRYSNSVGCVFLENDFTELLESDHAPDLWIFANGMDGCDAKVGRTRLLSNTCGYVIGRDGPENPNFDPYKTVTIGSDDLLDHSLMNGSA